MIVPVMSYLAFRFSFSLGHLCIEKAKTLTRLFHSFSFQTDRRQIEQDGDEVFHYNCSYDTDHLSKKNDVHESTTGL